MSWGKNDWKKATKYITKKDGTSYTAWELKSAFLDMLSEGKECFPLGECDNFDWKQGCLGHYYDEIKP